VPLGDEETGRSLIVIENGGGELIKPFTKIITLYARISIMFQNSLGITLFAD